MTEIKLTPIPKSALIQAVQTTHDGLSATGGSIGYDSLGLHADAGFRAVLTEKPHCVMFCANTVAGREINMNTFI